MSTLAQVTDLLRCPLCGGGLTLTERVLRCTAGHCFDVAKQGYVNLLGSAPPANADTSAMVAARERFLSAGWFDPIDAALARRLGPARVLLEAGAGTGYHLAAALDDGADRRGLALDISPAACRRAAQAHPRMGAAVADTWVGLPVRDGSIDAVVVVFAPKNIPEFVRVLRPGGLLLAVAPEPDHLAKLRQRWGLLAVPAGKAEDLLRAAAGRLEAVGRERVAWPLNLSADAAADLVAMGPNAFHGADAQPADIRTHAHVSVSWLRKPIR